MESQTLRNKILIIGRSSQAKQSIVKELFVLSNQKVPKELESENCLDESALSLPFKIDNKYYSANLDLWIDSEPDAPGTEVVAAYEPIAQLIDAIIFVYTNHDSTSFTDIFPWSEFVKKWEPAVALCIQSPFDKECVNQESTEPFDWCIENGFEFIDLTTEDSDAGDITRIYEALESNIWEGLTRKEATSVASQPHVEHLLPDHEGDLPSCEEIDFMRKRIFSGIDSDPFSEIQRLREHALTLSDAERRVLAAKVALSFGDEMGSDSDEHKFPSEF
ncbi:hypothetical protein DSO57_1015791 [Entomophthora muscae]|uniref:Uncharacterized protein n=1 Tax=Entomophthora muscae TaxID=34485 RepID=A0ACC2T516_9FUNG|nr:hypothetical protein DSO57_1015791 [Entomophthora muscae]